jgi:hypothetical protein
MNIPVRIGMDTSKSVFQLHGVDENEVVVVRRQFRRAEMIRYFERLPPVLVAIESLRQLAPLGPPAAVVWARGKANPASVCEGHVGGIMSFAKDRGIIATNPCERGGRLYVADRKDKIWTEEDIAAVLAVASSEIQLALVLALWSGQRQGDLLRLASLPINNEGRRSC